MVTTVSKRSGRKKRSRKFSQAVLGKPTGVIQSRVQAVQPEHFGVVAVDCAKDRSKWMFRDFYGNVLVAPTAKPSHVRNTMGVLAHYSSVRLQVAGGSLYYATWMAQLSSRLAFVM